MLDEFLPRRPYVPLVHSGSSNVSMAATEKPHDRTPIADVRSQSPPSPSKCNTPLFRSAQTESLDKVENVSGARIMMTAGVGPTRQPIQRSLPRFSSVSLTLMRDKLMLVVKLRKAEVAALRFATATAGAGAGRRGDPILTSAPANPRESRNHRRLKKTAAGTIDEGAAQHPDLQCCPIRAGIAVLIFQGE